MAWWKYGSQPDPSIRDLDPTANSGGLFRTYPDPVPVNIPARSQRPTSNLPIPVSIPFQPVRNWPKRAEPEPTPVPDTPLPTFTITTEQFEATVQRTYSPDRIPTFQPTTVPKTPLPTFSKPRTVTSYMTYTRLDPRNNPTSIPKNSLPFTRQRTTRRSTRRPVTTSSVRTTTRPKMLKKFPFSIPLKSEKYDCKVLLWNCKYTKHYVKLLQNAQGN